MILAGVGVKETQVVHGDYHRPQRGIDLVPLAVRDSVCALQVVAHTHGTDADRGIVGQQEHPSALREEFYATVYDSRVGKGRVMAFRAYPLYSETILALLREYETLCKPGSDVTADGLVVEVCVARTDGVYHCCEAVNLFVCLRHHHESAATMFHQARDELQLSLELQARIIARVGM